MINIGIIGCGRILNKHLSAIKKNKNFYLSAICDVDANAFKKLGKLDTNFYLDITKMVNNENLDMVSILTPSGLHYKNFLQINRSIKNILIEKPLTTNATHAKKLYDQARKNKNNVFVVMQNRFNKPIIALKEILNKEKLGKVFLTSVRVRWSRDEKYYNLAKWRGTKKDDGGVLFNQAAHHVDMMTYLNGPIKTVKAFKNNYIVKNINHEDTIVATIKFINGSIGSLEVTVATRPSDLEGSISVLGSKGSVEISGFSMDEIKHWNFYQKYKKPYIKSHNHIYGIGHVQLYREIFKAINNKKNIAPTVKDGYENVKLIEKIYKSTK